MEYPNLDNWEELNQGKNTEIYFNNNQLTSLPYRNN